jgi:hypothetical protein
MPKKYHTVTYVTKETVQDQVKLVNWQRLSDLIMQNKKWKVILALTICSTNIAKLFEILISFLQSIFIFGTRNYLPIAEYLFHLETLSRAVIEKTAV